MLLRQATAVDVLIGPFVDLTDGATSEVGETPSVKLSKNGQSLAAKSDVTVPVHDADGYYNCELDATDINTVGALVLTVAATATALPVRHEFQVVEEATYNFLYATAATPLADINAEVDTGISDAALATAANLATVDANVDAILVDTGTALPASLAALNDYDPTTQMAESYAANGVAPTRDQCMMAVHQMLMQFGIGGTALTVRKLDDTTTAFVVTLNDATNPTGNKRV